MSMDLARPHPNGSHSGNRRMPYVNGTVLWLSWDILVTVLVLCVIKREPFQLPVNDRFTPEFTYPDSFFPAA